MLDRDTGEVVEQTLSHDGETVREFYAAIPKPAGFAKVTCRSVKNRRRASGLASVLTGWADSVGRGWYGRAVSLNA
jgi:hypothetical protein